MQDQVDFAVEFKYENLCSSLFVRRVVEESRHAFVSTAEWTTDAPSFLDRLDEILGVQCIAKKSDDEGLEAAVFYLQDFLVYLQIWRSRVQLRIAGDGSEVDAVEGIFKRLLPSAELDGRVKVSFWFWGSHAGSPQRVTRVLEVPTWEEIAPNYPAETRQQLDRLIRHGIDPSAGQLLLWFGEPGCGKTYALRALIKRWQDRFKVHYISDTDAFFSKGEYMFNVLLHSDRDHWNLFILEDAGEFLLPDARQEMGQGLSRLLNASDGLIGQGLKSMFLITTNEPMSKLHPAVSRPGRCAAQIEFGDFSPTEAEDWLAHRGHAASELHGSQRLADLYALIRGDAARPGPVKVGF